MKNAAADAVICLLKASYIRSTDTYCLLIGKQLFSDPKEVLSILSESLNEAFLHLKEKKNISRQITNKIL